MGLNPAITALAEQQKKRHSREEPGQFEVAEQAWIETRTARFEDLGLSDRLIKKLIDTGYCMPEELHPHYAPETMLDRQLHPSVREWKELRGLRNRMPQDGFMSTLR